MMNIKFLSLFVLIAGMTFFTGCGNDDENDGMDDTTFSNKEKYFSLTNNGIYYC